MDIVNLFFSFKGKLNRMQYLIAMLIITAITLLIRKLHATATPEDTMILLIVIIVSIPLIVASWAVTVKRIRDIGWTLWCILLFFIPLVNLIMVLICLFKPGKDSAVF